MNHEIEIFEHRIAEGSRECNPNRTVFKGLKA